MKTSNELQLRDLPVEQELATGTARGICGGLAPRGSPYAVTRHSARDFIPVWDPGPSIDDAATAGDDSAYYGLRPIR